MKLNKRSSYEVQVAELTPGEHVHSYQLDDEFFRLFEESPVTNGALAVQVKIESNASVVEASFAIEGRVELTCDKSLALFDFPIQVDEKVFFKWGPGEETLDVNLYQIDAQAYSVNLAQHLYDFICLAIPFRKIAPSAQNNEEEEKE